MIHLLNMPFSSVMRGNIAVGLMKAQCDRAGIAARAHNLNFMFAKTVGFKAYESVAMFRGTETQVGEWLFADAAWRRPFGPSEDEFLRLCGEELGLIPDVPDPIAWLRRARKQVVPAFLEYAYRRLTADGIPRAVAFSCLFFQTVPSLALGRLLKERHPEVVLAYGGASFHGEMGEEMFEKVPWIDVLSTGEADDVFVPMFDAMSRGERPSGLAGILTREADGRVASGPPPHPMTAEVLESLPDPDYTSFFDDARDVGLLRESLWLDRASLPFEASRGCWWGAKTHCRFCGLNAEGISFRAKTADNVIAMLRRFAAKYPLRNLHATDNIMATSYFESFLPKLKAEPLVTPDGKKVDLFFEVKPNMKREQVKALADANVYYVQPGIESLSSHFLEVIGKGVKGLQNVFFLKCATEYQLVVIWNILIRAPNEDASDYKQMEEWIPRLFHLRPPTGGAPKIECHRFSPYFFRTGEYTSPPKPARWYRGIVPEDQLDLGRIAYYFDVDWKNTLGDPAYDRVISLVHEWRARWGEGTEAPQLIARDTEDNTMEIDDTRGAEPVRWQLDAKQAAVYRAIRDAATANKVQTSIALELSLPEVQAILSAFVDQGLALREREYYLGLALPPIEAVPLHKRQIQLRRVSNQLPRPEPAQPAARVRLQVV